jgi:L-glyceraldehyde 3-phosphate reductase
MNDIAQMDRYSKMTYRPCGRSGLRLPVLSLGLWHNFGHVDTFANARKMIRVAFDNGITHFDLANNYGPPPGSAEENFGRILKLDLGRHRDEMVISTKAGHLMWPGPYGDGGSRKYLLASLDQSLKRMGLDYVDIFYSHRYDPDTPIEETCEALVQAVRQGKALYAGLSKYPAEQTQLAYDYLKSRGVALLIYQARYSMFHRQIETDGVLDAIGRLNIGCIAFSPLAQGLLTDKYLNDIPPDSRAANPHGFLQAQSITDDLRRRIRALNDLAQTRGQKLAQMAIAWLARDRRVTSVLIGASRPEHILDNLAAFQSPDFSDDEIRQIEAILAE